ncbi:MAG: 16S rRNA (cytosine(1402)-N(4))-methyltransferase RsmH [Actinomycetia bacterium]|nr:16S rRNA (cytosine(1402)-N(4))-methyltransferase RsmH [Actinomycetes bacterium]
MTVEHYHTPVMVAEVKRLLALAPGEVFCDATLGAAGHSLALASALAPDGLLVGIDQDAEARTTAAERLQAAFPDLTYRILDGNFAQLDDLLLSVDIPKVDKFLFDLGVSSHQLDAAARGFSYAREAPLDMRMDPNNQSLTAAEIVNSSSQAELIRILQDFGEERFAVRIAKRILQQRQWQTYVNTTQLAETVREAIPAAARRSGGHPAKRSFQALRIAVNGELDALRQGLEAALRWLPPGGRLAVISYHSLEDRIVKQCFATACGDDDVPPELAVASPNQARQPAFELLCKKAVLPGGEELALNSRSASAKLRAIVKRREAVEL